ncbi:MAG: beta-propeller fold lactonase family protein [Rhodococcus sp. (in: high G+C Gram-positive bacteria)]
MSSKTLTRWSAAVVVSLVAMTTVAPATQAGPFAYICNSEGANVSVVDIATNTVTATVAVGAHPYGVAVTPDGARVYVSNVNSNTVSVISAANNTVIATVTVGSYPYGVAVTPDGSRVYVANGESYNVSVISTATNTVIATVAVGGRPKGVAVTPDGSRAYVANGNNVSVISTATNTVTATVAVGDSPDGVAITPDGTRVYVANVYPSNGGNNVSVISTATNTVTSTVTVGGTYPSGVAVTPDGSRVYVTIFGGDHVSVISTATNTVTATVPVGGRPIGVAVTSDGSRVYVANYTSNNLSVISTATNTVTATVPVGSYPIALGLFITPGAAPPPPPARPTITNSPPPNGTVSVAYSFAYTSTGSPTFRLTAGNLPPGLSLSSAGVLSGIPSATGTFSGTVTASNGTPPDATQNFSITVVSNSCGNSPGNVFVNYLGVTSSCSPSRKNCLAGETILFSPQPFGYNIQSCDTFHWDFGDNTTSTSANPTKSYPLGTYTVRLTVTNPNGSRSQSETVVVTTTAPTISSFAPEPAAIVSGGSSILRWVSANGATAMIDNGVGVVPLTGSVTVRPTRTTTYTLIVAAGAQSVSRTLTVTVQPAPARVVITALPSPLAQAPGAAGATTTYALQNAGDSATTINLQQTGDFFSQSPTSFSLPAGATQIITVTAMARTPGEYPGTSVPSGSGFPAGVTLPIRLIVAAPSTASAVASVERIDVSAPSQQTTVEGSASFRNDGPDAITAAVSTDVTWIVPRQTTLTIAPNSTATVGFTIDRNRRPDGASPIGTTLGTIAISHSKKDGTTAKSTAKVADTASLAFKVATLGPLPADEVALFLPGIGRANSGVGTFVTDLILANIGNADISNVSIFYTMSSGETVGTNLSLQAAQIISVADFINSSFNRAEDLGTLQIRVKRSEDRLIASARVFITKKELGRVVGTYGSIIPLLRSDRATVEGASTLLPGLLSEAGISNTNFVIQETAGFPTSVRTLFYNSNGVLLGTPTVDQLAPFQVLRKNNVVPEGAVLAYLFNIGNSEAPPESTGRFAAFATPVDKAPEADRTLKGGDTWVVADWSRVFGYTHKDPVVVPVVGRVRGANNLYYRSDLAISGATTELARANVSFYPRGGTVITKPISVANGRSLIYKDVMESLFGLTNPEVGYVGYILITPTTGGVAVSSRTYATQGSQVATFGTGVPVLSFGESLKRGAQKRISGLPDTRLATVQGGTPATYRTNVGLLEVSGKPIKVKVTARYKAVAASAGQLAAPDKRAERTYDLAANQFLQLPKTLLAELEGETRELLRDLEDVSIDFEVVSGDGSLMVYTSSIDNASGDQVLRTE